MIHVRAMKVPRGNKHGPLYGYYASSGFGPPNTKEQIRRGVLLSTVASVLILVGSLLTWLVYTEVFGSKVPIMGPLVMALGILLVILSIRQFFIVWKQRKNKNNTDKTEAGAAGEEDDQQCDSMLEMDTWEGEKLAYFHNSQQTSYYGNVGQSRTNTDVITPLCTDLSGTTSAVLPYKPLPFSPPAVYHTDSLHSHTQQMSPAVQYNADNMSQVVSHNTSDTSPAVSHNTGNISQVVTYNIGDVSRAVTHTTSDTSQPLTTVVTSEVGPKMKSCCDLSSMARSGSMETPNPRPVIRYSQGQLELLDRQAAAMGRTSPTLVTSAPSHQSLGERSSSPHERTSHKSLSLSIERTDILETI